MGSLRKLAAWSLTLLILAALGVLTASNLAARPALARAEEAQRHKNTLNALAAALDELAVHPRDPRAARLAALSLSTLIYAHEAEPFYAIARSRGLLSDEDLHVRALGLARSNHPDEALAAYREILERHPEDARALQRASAIEWTRGELYRAFEFAARLARTKDGAIAGLTLQGTLHREASHFQEAVPFYEEVLKRDPQLQKLPIAESIFWREFSECLLAVGRASEVRAYLIDDVERLKAPILFSLLGLSQEAKGDFTAAEASWRRALELDPTSAPPLMNLGRTAFQRNSLDEAERLLRASLRSDPTSYEANYLMSLLLRRRGRLDEARKYTLQAQEIRRRIDATPQVDAASKSMPPAQTPVATPVTQPHSSP